jgi:hypothetical protein
MALNSDIGGDPIIDKTDFSQDINLSNNVPATSIEGISLYIYIYVYVYLYIYIYVYLHIYI